MDFMKSVWRASPQWARLLFCQALCGIFAQKSLETEEIAGTSVICGAFASASGLGNSARLYADNLERNGQAVFRLDVTKTMRMAKDLPLAANILPIKESPLASGAKKIVIHANPPQFQLVLCSLGRDFLRGKRVIAYWAWELEEFPPVWKHALDYVDAVETPSEFVAEALRRITKKPVRPRPHPLPEPAARKTVFARDGKIRCLNIFDAGSSWERKNPEAALAAFASAFRPGEAEMTFKICNREKSGKNFWNFRQMCEKISGVKIECHVLDKAQMTKLYLEHDIYLALHRSEGFGLPLAEALNLGLHVVATGWSGNMDFMNGSHAHPVPYRLVPTEFDYGPCKGLKARWAEADIWEAAKILRALKTMLQRKNNSSPVPLNASAGAEKGLPQ